MSDEARSYLLELNASGLRFGGWLGPVKSHKQELVELGILSVTDDWLSDTDKELDWVEYRVTEAGQLIIDQLVSEQ